MSEQSQQDKQVPPQNEVELDTSDAPPFKPVRPKQGFFSSISLTHLTLVVMVVAFLWQWLEERRIINDLQHQLAEKINEMVSDSNANHLLLTKNQGLISELNDKVAILEKRNGAVLSQRTAQNGWYDDLLASREETVLAEVEQMLLNAEQQLQLSANVRAALIVMQNADAHLQRMSQSTFKVLHEVMVRDMEKLRSLPSIDINGINTQLNDLLNAVDELQVASQQRVVSETAAQSTPPADEAFTQRLRREIWHELKQLVQIENTEMDVIPLLPPSQQFFLRENLKLRLLSARVALLSRDESVFKQDMKASQRWTQRYFDTKSEPGSAMLSEMNKLSGAKISVVLPNLDASLQAVRNYRLMREKAVQ